MLFRSGGGGGELPPHWEATTHQGAAGEGLPEYWPPREGLLVGSFSIIRFQFYALYVVVKYHHVYVMNFIFLSVFVLISI